MANNKKVFQDLYNAYVYAYPAVILELTRRVSLNPSKDGKQSLKTNTLYHTTALADASFKNVVAPNIDTVYSQAWLDLSEGALIFEKPELDRYVSIAFLDAYTNCENIIGTGGDGNQKENYLITGPNFTGEVPEGYKQLALPTNKNWVIVRTIIYGKDDVEAVKEIQSKLQFKTYGNAKQEVINPAYRSDFVFKPIEKITNLSLEEFFTIFNELLIGNPDKYAPQGELKQWKDYGIGAGETFTSDEEIRKIENEVKQKFLEETSRGLTEGGTVNYWSYPDDTIGIYKTDYLLRANVARNGLGANPVTMCVYPATYVDSEGNPLDGRKRYQIHFEKGQLPPVKEHGFWSITLYDSKERYLVENEIHRYGINDRDKLKENEDGSIDILVQQERPEEKWVSNWLPSGNEAFNLILRIYLTKETVISGEWKPPVIRQIL
ncbi:DUF1254 domain-containing protein [Roseburia sp. 499]|uniref:DUF1254 domain-containing protein n=1 Tax=Roseburia sp. 499 TaxID=1261634 RepID=UPI0009529AFF|nr:DUF1254 domain-containing protein [Roseburia sp. 499]WVK69007.1 DUF1214 domain-containing protein [Roseburia sp. 499]